MQSSALKPLSERLNQLRQFQKFEDSPLVTGRITRMVGLTLEAVGINVSIGSNCLIKNRDGREIEVEVVGFEAERTFLMPVHRIDGLEPGAKVIPIDRRSHFVLGDHLIGRVTNGVGKPLDGLGAFDTVSRSDVIIKNVNPMQRAPIDQPLDVGIRAINALLTVGKGQRIGLFAGSGVGKSVLLGMMTRYTAADIVVVGLIGERGREIKEFIDHTLGEEGLKKAVVIASPADDAPLMRLRAAQLTARVAEYFRDQGKNVLMLMDSLTRYGQAQREIALSVGEPPATKGYPPSVFSKIPELVERAGNGEQGGGSITAFYTVLTEGDDMQDPIADASRAILDGHIVLSRALAEEGLYPAIDIEASISRVMPSVVDADQLAHALHFKRLLANYSANKDLLTIGAYTKGNDKELDEAIARFPSLRNFIAQGITEGASMQHSVELLTQTLSAAVDVAEPEAETP